MAMLGVLKDLEDCVFNSLDVEERENLTFLFEFAKTLRKKLKFIGGTVVRNQIFNGY